jgi:hypothetical protein
MPENENIIPEAEVVETVEQVANPISFSPVTKDEDDIVVEQQEEIIPEQADVIQEEQVEEVAETPIDDDYEVLELNEDYAMEFLAQSKGMTVDELKDSLTPREQKKYAPEMEKFSEFIEKTGNTNYNDFKETQKDWSAESEESRLRNYLFTF